MSKRTHIASLLGLFLSGGLIASPLPLQAQDIASRDERLRPPLPPTIAAASADGEQAIAGFQLSGDWLIQLFAAEPDVANVVAFDIDNQGRLFACETFRQNKGVTDNRGHDETWLRADLAAKTVQDRIAYHHRLLGENVLSYTEQDDRIRLLVDSDGDGKADQSTVYASGFNRIEDGTAAGVLARGKNVYLTNIPKLYNLIDQDGDGQADDRIVMSDGYGVRVAFRGHDMHGLIIGPDGRLYFSIGDRGYHVQSGEGELFHNPAVGAVFRCELDGSGLQLFAKGLRNPQELAFNDWGDLFTGDNNSDSGDQARLVHVVQDGDTGWRMYYQYLPDRGPFNREGIWRPFHDEQPAYLMPPITNFADGPSGLTYYPGTGFGDQLRDTFLLADFRGTAGNSGVRTFQLDADGAFYKLKNDGRFIWSILATDVAFGPEGAVYVSDWVNGWDGEGKGRIYRISDPQQSQSEIVVEVARLLASDWATIPTDALTTYLGHVDRRVRNESQWELARRTATVDLLRVATTTDSPSLARLHAIWGLDQIYRRSTERSSVLQQPLGDAIAKLLGDDDAVLRAAAAKFAGENRLPGTTDRLIEMLSDASPRVRYHAARAIGWQSSREAFEPIVQLLMDNDNRDPVLRHGGIMALASVAEPDEIAKLKSHSSTNVRRAATVALRHLRAGQITEFLNDGDTRVVAEAVRAIHDEQIDSAANTLANLIDRPLEDSNVIQRVLNANFRLGGADHARALVRYASQESAPEAMRLEAIAMLADWESPDERDRVLNDWRPLPERPIEMVVSAVREYLPNLLSGPDSVRNATIELAASLGLTEIAPLLVQRVDDANLPASSRAAALRAMIQLSPEEAITRANRLLSEVESPSQLRVVAIAVLATLQKSQATDLLIRSTQERWSVQERQAAWDAIADSDSPAAKQAITVGLAAVPSDSMEPVLLNLIEAAQRKTLEEPLTQALARIEAASPQDPLRPWLGTMQGGDPARGANLFFTKTELSCVRCHKVGDQGGDVGPNLTGIAKEKDRRYLLEAIVLPDQQIAKGFETTVLADDLGASHIGIVRSETEEYIDLVKADGSQVRLLVDEIVARRRGQSAMPADLVKFLTTRELRDLVAYLASLDQPPGATQEKEGH